MEPILRYLSKEKLEWLLSDKGIYIGAASDQSDKKEGIYDHNVWAKDRKYQALKYGKNEWKAVDKQLFDLMMASREKSFLSSWYLGNDETEEMWDEYGKNGVAIASNTFSLIEELPEPIGQASSFYKVIYCNERKRNGLQDPLKYKSENFAHENEFRLVVNLKKFSFLTGYRKEEFGELFVGNVPSYQSEQFTCCMSNKGIVQSHNVIFKKGDGYVIKYDLNKIISEIRLNPYCSKNEAEELTSLCVDSGLTCAIRRSTLKPEE